MNLFGIIYQINYKLKAAFKSQLEVVDVFPKKISINYEKNIQKKFLLN